jgi:two-component system alkaline phosphatase synthesis response regulator PhoP
MRKILIIEDDHDISDLLSIHINDLGYRTDLIDDGTEGLMKAVNHSYELIILDLRLPGMDGLEICRRLRIEKVYTPVLMLTAKSEEVDRVVGLEVGADDYITKPFSVRELIARVKAILRRIEMDHQSDKSTTNEEIRHGDLYIHTGMRTVELQGRRIELSPKEFDLLVQLASNPGRTYSRIQLLDLVWGYEFEGFEHTVNSHINRLRSKIEENRTSPQYILTTWGVGYRFSES